MTQTSGLVQELKKQLKLRGITYRQLAEELSLSESAVKQMFASGNMTLARLDRLCEILGLSISDLVSLTDANAQQLQSLTAEQETELIDDPKLLLVAYCLVNHWSFDDITHRYSISEVEGIRYLARLDRMKLIELLPGNRVKPLIASNFNWQKNGPIERYFRQEVQHQFFHSDFDEDGCLRLVKNGDISRVAREHLIDRMQQIGQQFDETVRSEKKLPYGERHGTTMVLAIRHWQLSAFQQFEREVLS